MTLPDTLVNQAQLEAAAQRLAGRILGPATFCLEGPLGAGKSTFARAFLRAFGVPGDIPSPTFTLVEVYDGYGPNGIDIWHVDAYRLISPQEAEPLGLIEAFDMALCLVEWPDKLGSLIPDDAMHIHIAHAEAADMRRLTLP